MDTGRSRMVRTLAMAVAFLVAVAVFQGYYMMRMHHQLKTFATADLGDVKEADPLSSQPPAGSHGRPLPPAFQSPFKDDWFKPFDAKMPDPFKEMEKMQRRMEAMMHHAFGQTGPDPIQIQDLSATPKTDITEDDNAYTIKIQTGGSDGSKVQARVENGMLTVSGTRVETVSQGPRQERRLGQFSQTIPLPGPVKQEGLKARCEDGVLIITVPKEQTPSQGIPIPSQ